MVNLLDAAERREEAIAKEVAMWLMFFFGAVAGFIIGVAI